MNRRDVVHTFADIYFASRSWRETFPDFWNCSFAPLSIQISSGRSRFDFQIEITFLVFFEVWIFFCKNNFDFLSPAGSPAWPRGDRQAGQQAALPQCYRWQYSQPSFYFDFINTSISDLDELHLSYLQFFPSYQHRDKARSVTWAKNNSIRAPSFISTFRLLSLITEIGSWSQVKQRKKPKGTKISREHKSE